LFGFGLAALAVTGCTREPAASVEPPRAEYQSGRLSRLTYDVNKNGRNDAVGIMDGARIQRIELDLDENGKTERWDIYGADRKLEKVGLSRLNDGVMDSQAFYNLDGALSRLEVSTARDGRFDRSEIYESGVLVRSEEDRNRDGHPDKWETYRPYPEALPGEPAYAITSVAYDDSGIGRPQRRFVFGPKGAVARVELDPDGDGTFINARQSNARNK
jgi:hypothetical protein